MALLLTQCEPIPTGHVPTTSAAVVDQIRADLVAKHLAIVDSECSMMKLRFDGKEWERRQYRLPTFLSALGATESGDALLLRADADEKHRGEVLVVDKDRNLLRTLQTGCGGMYMISRNLKRVACEDSSGLAWSDLGSGKWIRIALDVPEEMVNNCAWSPQADRLAYDKGGKLYIYDTVSRRSAFLADGTAAAWSPDGTWIAYHLRDDIRLISPDGTASRTLIPLALKSTGQRLEWSPDSQYILTVFLSDQRFSLTYTGTEARIEVVRVSDGAELTADWMPLFTHYGLVWLKD
jgi:hypothetical protein